MVRSWVAYVGHPFNSVSSSEPDDRRPADRSESYHTVAATANVFRGPWPRDSAQTHPDLTRDQRVIMGNRYAATTSPLTRLVHLFHPHARRHRQRTFRFFRPIGIDVRAVIRPSRCHAAVRRLARGCSLSAPSTSIGFGPWRPSLDRNDGGNAVKTIDFHCVRRPTSPLPWIGLFVHVGGWDDDLPKWRSEQIRLETMIPHGVVVNQFACLSWATPVGCETDDRCHGSHQLFR